MVALKHGCVAACLLMSGLAGAARANDTDPASPPPGWKLTWSDEFNGDSIDRSHWGFEIGNGGGGWGNNEKEYYTDRPDNAFVKGRRSTHPRDQISVSRIQLHLGSNAQPGQVLPEVRPIRFPRQAPAGRRALARAVDDARGRLLRRLAALRRNRRHRSTRANTHRRARHHPLRPPLPRQHPQRRDLHAARQRHHRRLAPLHLGMGARRHPLVRRRKTLLHQKPLVQSAPHPRRRHRPPSTPGPPRSTSRSSSS